MYPCTMSTILLVTDSDRVVDTVFATLTDPDTEIIVERDPAKAADTAYTQEVDDVLVDMQVGSMGAVAVTHAVRDAARDIDPIPVTILLDRDADAFQARRSGAASWVLKTASGYDLKQAIAAAGTAT